MANSQHYDAVVIGSGQGGNPLAGALAAAGRKTAIIEREHVGGTCINEGCTPTKTMVASAKVAYLDRRSLEYGVQDGPVGVDMVGVRKRKRDIVDNFRTSGEQRLEDAENLDLIRGKAHFTGPKELAVRLEGGETLELTAGEIFINVGARPGGVPVEGIDDVAALNSTTIMELGEVREHLLVLGGGHVGIEFAQMFRRFGSKVTVVQRGPQLLAREDEDVAEAVAEILREDGANVLLQTEAQGVRQDGRGIRLAVGGPDGERTLTGSDLLVAAGRPPNTEVLHLQTAGIEMDGRGFVEVDDRLEANVPGVWALGDIKGGPVFTHITDRLVPYTVLMDPQLGRVGLSEAEARERGYDVRAAKMPMNYVARAIEMGESRGMMKAVVDGDSGEILGIEDDDPDSHDGQVALFGAARRRLRTSYTRRVAQHPVRDVRRMMRRRGAGT